MQINQMNKFQFHLVRLKDLETETGNYILNDFNSI